MTQVILSRFVDKLNMKKLLDLVPTVTDKIALVIYLQEPRNE